MSNGNRVPLTLRDFFWNDPFFSSSWGDFRRMREEMFQESQKMFLGFEEAMTEDDTKGIQDLRDRKSSESKKEVERSLLPKEEISPWFFPRRWMLPPTLLTQDFAKEFGKDDQVIRVQDKDDKFEISLDTHKYKPDELKVNIKDGVVSVEGQHEDKSQDGRTFASRQFRRMYTLPQNCSPESVVSNLSSDGVLMITAPKAGAIQNQGRNVPITKE